MADPAAHILSLQDQVNRVGIIRTGTIIITTTHRIRINGTDPAVLIAEEVVTAAAVVVDFNPAVARVVESGHGFATKPELIRT